MRRLQVLPCPESWERMRPDGEGRFCERCQLRVTEVAKLDGDGLAGMVRAAASGRVCARFELEQGRPRTALGLAAGLVVVALVGCATPVGEATAPVDALTEPVDLGVAREGGGVIGGRVVIPEGVAGAGAIVILQSTALPSELERVTDERGVYIFDNLPPGNYTIQVLFGKANTIKITQLPEGARFRANFSVDPEQDVEIFIGMVTERPMIDTTSASSTYSSRLLEYH